MTRSVFAVLFVLLLLPVSAQAVTVEKVVSPGGIEAWLVQDHTNPIVTLSFSFEGGAALDPKGKDGLADMASSLLDEGAGDLDSLAFQTRLEDKSIRLSFSAAQDRFTGSLQTLSGNRDEAVGLLALALSQPRFDADPVERIRAQIVAGLKRRLEDPDTIAGRAWFAARFPGHPYGRPADGTPESVARITRDDLKTFVAERFARDGLTVGAVGDITPEQLGPLLDQAFGALPAAGSPALVLEVVPEADGGTKVIRRDIPQSVAVFGHGGLKRDDPDWYAAYTLNYILGGGGFSSRLMEEVREKRGLAYSVYSYLYPYDHTGLYVGGVSTQNARIGESLDLIRAEWARMAEQGPTEQELTDAKTYLTGAFPLRFSSSGKIAGILVAMQTENLGIDYLDKRNGYIEALTMADLKRVAKRLLRPENLSVVVVGAPDGLEAETEGEAETAPAQAAE